MAAGALQAAREDGIQVPGELSIVGFDDHDFSGPMGLTTVRQPVDRQGEEATRALLDAVEDEPWDKDLILDHELIIRSTTSEPSG